METQAKYPLPNYKVSDSTDTLICANLESPSDPKYFEGHFPGFSILPGITLMSWTFRFAEEQGFACKHHPIKNLKFKRVIQQAVPLTISLSIDKAKQQIKFSWSTNEQICASGVLELI